MTAGSHRMRNTKHAALKSEILALATRPEGFGKSQVHSADHNMVTRVVDSMVNKQPQILFTAFINRNHVRYFDKPARAEAYRNLHVVAIKPDNQTIVRKRGISAPEGQAVTPAHVQVQVCPGIERIYAPKPPVNGAFSSTPIGRYPFPGTWSDNVLRHVAEAA